MRRHHRKRVTRGLIVAAVVAFATGLTLLLAMTSGSSQASKGHVFASKLAAEEVVGNRGEQERQPDGASIELAASAEEYAQQAYPAAGIPLQATLNAQIAWSRAENRGEGHGHHDAWQLAGPDQAKFPDVLTFSGAKYTTSGRVTALALDPNNCRHDHCRVWVAAAGGGIWTTDHINGGNQNWKFLSDSFATNAIGTLAYTGGVLYAGTGEPNASADSEAGMGLYKSTDGGEHVDAPRVARGPDHDGHAWCRHERHLRG